MLTPSFLACKGSPMTTGSPRRMSEPLSGLIDTGQHLHDRRLAGAVLSDDRVDLAGKIPNDTSLTATMPPKRFVTRSSRMMSVAVDSVMLVLVSSEVPPGRASATSNFVMAPGCARHSRGPQIVVWPGHGLEVRVVLGHVLLVVVVLDLIVGLART